MRTAKEAVTQVETRASLCEDKILDPNIQDEINQANIEVQTMLSALFSVYEHFQSLVISTIFIISIIVKHGNHRPQCF